MSDGTASPIPLIAARRIVRRYGHVHALQGADFDISRGEIVALVGDNGAGKSTLVRILSGTDRPSEGEILVNGTPVRFDGPHHAQALGIETVYQDLALAPDLDAAANIFLGREVLRRGLLGRFGVLDERDMRRRADDAMKRLGVSIRSTTNVASLSGGQRQTVAVARAALWATSVIFMDEPTAALGIVQTSNVLELIRRVKASGTAVVLISHNLPQVLDVADRVIVLRLGQTVAQLRASATSVDELVRAMTSGTAHDRARPMASGI